MGVVWLPVLILLVLALVRRHGWEYVPLVVLVAASPLVRRGQSDWCAWGWARTRWHVGDLGRQRDHRRTGLRGIGERVPPRGARAKKV